MGLKAKLLYDLGLLKIWYKKKDRLYIKPLYNKYGEKSKLPGTVIYMLDGKIIMGGLGDRLHGMISLYQYCKNHGLNFKINHCSPFQLNDYLIPNKYDWNIDADMLQYNLNAAQPMMIACSARKNGGTLEQEAKFQKRYLDKTINRIAGKEYHIYTNAHFAWKSKLFSESFHELFKPSVALKDAVFANKEKIGNNYISVTLRFQNLLGDFKEADFPALTKENQEILMDKVRKKILEIHEQSNSEKVLITSDSRKFLDYMGNESFVYTIPGRVVHMSYTLTKDFETHLKSFVDLMMLADAQKLYLLVTGPMYQSGFAEVASFINNKPYEIIKW